MAFAPAGRIVLGRGPTDFFLFTQFATSHWATGFARQSELHFSFYANICGSRLYDFYCPLSTHSSSFLFPEWLFRLSLTVCVWVVLDCVDSVVILIWYVILLIASAVLSSSADGYFLQWKLERDWATIERTSVLRKREYFTHAVKIWDEGLYAVMVNRFVFVAVNRKSVSFGKDPYSRSAGGLILDRCCHQISYSSLKHNCFWGTL